MKDSLFPALLLSIVSLVLPACQKRAEEHHHQQHRVTATTPILKDVSITQQYVCQIHSFRHIEVRALEEGFLEPIKVKEGQQVKQGEPLYQVVPVLYQARLDSERAEANYALMELNNTKKLLQDKIVSEKEVALLEAKYAKAMAKVKQAEAELNFTTLKAPFDGIVDHQYHQQGSLIEAGDVLTTLSDNSTMWVYFNVPESRYLEYMAGAERKDEDLQVELLLAHGKKFDHIGKIGAIEADFNNQTGNIAFRADFPNPDHLLRHGQTGTVLLSRVQKDAVVIPQRATFEILAKKYVYVLEKPSDKPASGHDSPASEHGEKPAEGHLAEHAAASHGAPGEVYAAEHEDAHESEHGDGHDDKHASAHKGERAIVRQREIVIQNELDDIYVIKDGLNVDERIVLEGIQQVRDGEEVEYDYVTPEKALEQLKFHAE